MKTATNRLLPKWNVSDHGVSWNENRLHSRRKRISITTMTVLLEWQTQRFIRIQTASPPACV